MVEEKGTFVERDAEVEAMELAKLMEDPEVAAYMAERERELEFRRKIVKARKDMGYEQKTVGMLSGLDQRAISRVEVSKEVSPSLKTVIKYLGAIGYKLDITKVEA